MEKFWLEATFGGLLDASGINAASVQQVVAEQTPESELLDFKRDLWPRSPLPRPAWTEAQEFAKDAGALANHHGGVVLVGVHEVKGRASATAPLSVVSNPEADERQAPPGVSQ